MNEPKCLFKVGGIYRDREGTQVEIVHIIPDGETPYPVVGIRRNKDGARAKSYTINGLFMMGLPDDSRDLIPPAPPMKRVPLGPEDVPPGSVVSATNGVGWVNIQSVSPVGLSLPHSEWNWEDAMTGFQIKRPTDTGWQPMWKEIEDESSPE